MSFISRSSNSPESGIGNSHLSLGALGEHFQDIDGDDEFFDPEPLPVLGKCKALYPFEGNNDLAIDFGDPSQLTHFTCSCIGGEHSPGGRGGSLADREGPRGRLDQVRQPQCFQI